MWMPMQGIKFKDFMSVVCTSYSGMAVQLVQSWTNARARVVLHLHLRQCQSGSNVVMVICNGIKSQLSYFIVGQRKDCTYVYFHILYRFKTLYSRHYINILSIRLKFFIAPGYQRFFRVQRKFSVLAEGRSQERRSREKNLAFRAGHYKDLT